MASLRALAVMHPQLVGIEFDFHAEGMIRGWADEDGRIGMVPDGWHAYSVTDTDGNGFDPVAIEHHGAVVGHRFDFATDAALDDRIDRGRLAECDDWGFTREPITAVADKE